MIRRAFEDPRLVVLIILLLVISGIGGFLTRAQLEDPASSVRWGYVTTFLPGAIPEEVEAQVSIPIEQALRDVNAIRSIETSSMRGVSVIFVRLTDEVVDVNEVWSDVQDELSEVTGKLPAGTIAPVLLDERRWDSFTRIVALVDKSTTNMPPAVLARWGKEIESRLRFVPGTRFTELFGLPEEEILVELTEDSIAGTGLTVSEVAGKIVDRDSEAPDANAQTSRFNMSVRLTGDVNDLNRLRAVTLRGNESGDQLMLGDIASIHRGERTPAATTAMVEGRRAVVVATRMSTDSEINAWTDSQVAVLGEIEEQLPDELELQLLFSQQRYTDRRSSRLYSSLGIGMTLVILIVCLMMGWRAAIPICSALPLTMLGVAFLMMPFGISLHQMSIAGLILALGILIDNPIIVVDQIQRRRRAGEPAYEAMTNAVKHVTAPLVASNFTTILAFLPILLIPGPTGEFLGHLGWAVIACLAVSLMLSLTIIPIMAAWTTKTFSTNLATSVGNEPWLTRWYNGFLRLAFRRPILTFAVSVVLPITGFLVASDLREQFFPTADRDHFQFSLRLPSNSSIRDTQRVALAARELIMEHPDVSEVSLFVGTNAPKIHYSMISGDENRPNFAQGLVQLKTYNVKNSLIREIQAELNEEFPEVQSVVSLFEQGPPAPAPIEFRLYGPSRAQLADYGERAREILMNIPGVVQTRASLDPGSTQLSLNVKQHEAESAQLTDDAIARQIFNQIEGITLTSLSEAVEEIPIRVRVKDGDWSSPERVISFPLISSTGEVVPLGSVADWQVDQQLFHIHRRNASPCNVISAYVAAGELPVVIENRFRESLEAQNYVVQPGYRFDFGGISQQRDSAVGNLVSYAAIVSTLMLCLLVMTFGSFRQAAIIGLVGLLSIGLGLLSLWLFSYPIGIVAIIGVVGMMGLAINDSIVVLIDCKSDVSGGHSLISSVRNSTRHVLTTSFTTVGGVVPLILAGGEFWPPMMIVIAGGVIGATLLALGFTPSALEIVNGRWLGDRRGRRFTPLYEGTDFVEN